MARYRKKPVEIEAVQWTKDRLQATDNEWLSIAISRGNIVIDKTGNGIVAMIKTLEGEMTANEGDYIIRGVKGELYPCKPDIFEETYKPVD